jgi:hypothetical protein
MADRVKVSFDVMDYEITPEQLAALIVELPKTVGRSLTPGASVRLTIGVDISRDAEDPKPLEGAE